MAYVLGRRGGGSGGGGAPSGPAGGDLSGTYPNPSLSVAKQAELDGKLTAGAGAAFPGGPANNALFYRTDLDLLCFFDGTRWLTVDVYDWTTTPPADASVSSSFGRFPGLGGADAWIIDVRFSYQVPSNHTGGNFWTVALSKYNNSATTVVQSLVTDKATTTWNNPAATAVGALLGTTFPLVFWELTKSGTPGNLAWGAGMRYRRVVT